MKNVCTYQLGPVGWLLIHPRRKWKVGFGSRHWKCREVLRIPRLAMKMRFAGDEKADGIMESYFWVIHKKGGLECCRSLVTAK